VSGKNANKLTTKSNVYNNAVFAPDGGNPQQLTPNESFDFEPRISPDGRFIVFNLFFGTLDKVGTIEKGKRADLILLDANPLENISNTEKRNPKLSTLCAKPLKRSKK